MKHKLINFDWIVNNFIVHNLLINYLNFIKESIQKQLLTTVSNIKRKSSVLESLLKQVADLQLSCEYCKIFKNSFFHNTPPVTAVKTPVA